MMQQNGCFLKKSEKPFILKNGIEYEKFAFSNEIRKQVREELILEDETFVVGHVGRFNHQKNHSFLIEIFAHYHTINTNSKLLLVGDGPLRNEIEKKAKELQVRG